MSNSHEEKSFSIREATLNDCGLIHNMAEVVFRDTYKEILSQEQTEYMMEWMYSLDNLKKQMEEEHVFHIGYWGDEPCGYLSVQQESEDLFHLQKIYVMPQFQGKQIGKKLFEKAIHYIKSIHPTPCFMELNVNRDNKAIQFYERMGMKQLRQGDFCIGNGYCMCDYIMGMEL